ncbi:hypothetical protein TNCV_2625621 [Trichonephila clavipes]|nr:hypothetical protein TNCV_2625621 [Trichonephila clavipes]
MKLIERLIEEGGSDSGSRNFVAPKISENVVRLVGRHFPSYVESNSSKTNNKKNIAKITPSTHKMAPWVKRVFLHLLPRLLLMRRPAYPDDTPKNNHQSSPLQHSHTSALGAVITGNSSGTRFLEDQEILRFGLNLFN